MSMVVVGPEDPTFGDVLDSVADLFVGSAYCIVLTGAGMSTESGVPDFRTPGQGLWSKYDPTQVADIGVFLRKPDLFWSVFKELYPAFESAKPNPGHIALAALEKLGHVATVLTQNVDDLHQRAGSETVVELHGNLSRGRCMRCGKSYTHLEVLSKIDAGKLPPTCDSIGAVPSDFPGAPLDPSRTVPHPSGDPGTCGGLIKPDVIMFNEFFDRDRFARVIAELMECDLLIVLGSSLEIPYVKSAVDLVHQYGRPTVLVNLLPTPVDPKFKYVIRARVGETLPSILDRVVRKTGGVPRRVKSGTDGKRMISEFVSKVKSKKRGKKPKKVKDDSPNKRRGKKSFFSVFEGLSDDPSGDLLGLRGF